MTSPYRGPTTNTGIAIHPRLLAKAKLRAASLGRSFSRHVCVLLEHDLDAPALEDRISALERRVAEMPGRYGPPKG